MPEINQSQLYKSLGIYQIPVIGGRKKNHIVYYAPLEILIHKDGYIAFSGTDNELLHYLPKEPSQKGLFQKKIECLRQIIETPEKAEEIMGDPSIIESLKGDTATLSGLTPNHILYMLNYVVQSKTGKPITEEQIRSTYAKCAGKILSNFGEKT